MRFARGGSASRRSGAFGCAGIDISQRGLRDHRGSGTTRISAVLDWLGFGGLGYAPCVAYSNSRGHRLSRCWHGNYAPSLPSQQCIISLENINIPEVFIIQRVLGCCSTTSGLERSRSRKSGEASRASYWNHLSRAPVVRGTYTGADANFVIGERPLHPRSARAACRSASRGRDGSSAQ